MCRASAVKIISMPSCKIIESPKVTRSAASAPFFIALPIRKYCSKKPVKNISGTVNTSVSTGSMPKSGASTVER